MNKSIVLLFLLALLLPGGTGSEVESLLENGHVKRARPLAEAAYQRNPKDAHAAYLLARVRHELGKIDEAVKLAEIAVQLDPKSSPYHRELGEAYADQADNVSFLRQIGYAHKIHAEFDAALAIAPNDPDNLFDRMLYYLQAPGIAGGDKKKAVDIANTIMKIDAARGYLALARIAQDNKEQDKLEALYQKAVEANPRSYEAQATLTGWYVSVKHANPAQAEQHAKALVELNPDRAEGYRLLAMALGLDKRADDAAKVATRAESAIPDDLSPYAYAARGLLRSGSDLPRAETYLRKYIDETKEPESGAPAIAVAHWWLASVYQKESRKPEARSELETALRLKPDFEPAKKDLKRLK